MFISNSEEKLYLHKVLHTVLLQTFRCGQLIVITVHPCGTGGGGGGSLGTEGARLTLTPRVVVGGAGTHIYTGVVTCRKQTSVLNLKCLIHKFVNSKCETYSLS